MMTYAGFWFRVCAYVIDYIFLAIAGFVVAFVIAFLAGMVSLAPEVEEVLIWIWLIVVMWFYFAVLESSAWQATIGSSSVTSVLPI